MSHEPPIASSPVETPVHTWEPARSLPGEIQVLHVDDEPDFTELSARFLPLANDRIEVRRETDPEDALHHLRSGGGDIDCVVSDYGMPSMDGLTLLRTVRETVGPIPFIFFSSHPHEELKPREESSGVTAHVKKGGHEQYEKLADRIVAAVEMEIRR